MRKDKKLTIVLCGLAGSGKSTTAKLLARRFKLRRASAGDIFRAIAKKRGMSPIELGRYAAKHPAFDRTIDAHLVKEARRGNVIIDGRTTGYLTRKLRIPALRVFLAVNPAVSAKRVAKRDGVTVAEALRKSRLRERENNRRLHRLFGLDTSDQSYYDVVIHTDDYAPKEVVQIISIFVKYGN
jgi:cytidylate kinase